MTRLKLHWRIGLIQLLTTLKYVKCYVLYRLRNKSLADFHQKCICNRFVAGMLLLGKPKLCLLGPDASNLQAAPFIVLEILRQLSFRVHNLYFALFEQLRTISQCRSKIGYGQKMASAAFYIGKVHGAVAFLDKAVSNGVHSVCSTFHVNRFVD